MESASTKLPKQRETNLTANQHQGRNNFDNVASGLLSCFVLLTGKVAWRVSRSCWRMMNWALRIKIHTRHARCFMLWFMNIYFVVKISFWCLIKNSFEQVLSFIWLSENFFKIPCNAKKSEQFHKLQQITSLNRDTPAYRVWEPMKAIIHSISFNQFPETAHYVSLLVFTMVLNRLKVLVNYLNSCYDSLKDEMFDGLKLGSIPYDFIPRFQASQYLKRILAKWCRMFLCSRLWSVELIFPETCCLKAYNFFAKQSKVSSHRSRYFLKNGANFLTLLSDWFFLLTSRKTFLIRQKWS